jgi:transcriptional regulator with XRE-family HTH domain
MSQGSLGRRLRVTFSQIQKYEKGSNRIGAGRLYQFAEILGVPVQYFFEDLKVSAHEQHSRSASTVATDAESMRVLVERIPDPNARQALLALASSMASG